MAFPSFTFAVLLHGLLVHSLFFTPSLATLRASTAARSKTSSSLSVRDGKHPCVKFFQISDQTVFPAADAYNCLISVPFDKAVASQFIRYYKDTLEFQSTLAYLKDPPLSYQQTRVDILSALDLIATGVETDVFRDEYAFEAAMQNVVQASHDSHIKLDAGALNVFSFGSPYAISSVSMDGIELPKVYFTDDLTSAQEPGNDVKPSPIKLINNQDATEWLTQFAALNSFGLLEPNADWNALMYNPAADIQNKPSVFTGQSRFYPGDKLEFVLEDGTKRSTRWLALAAVPFDTPTIDNGEDLYSFFVLNDLPSSSQNFSFSSDTPSPSSTSSYSEDAPTATQTALPSSSSGSQSVDTPTSWAGVPAYPSNPDIVQRSLGYGGFLTGYFLDDSSIAVISIPSFEMTGSALSSFSGTIGRFLQRSKRAGLQKVVIDLQQNYGGEVLLAVDTFKQFFPSEEPFSGSRLRASRYSDALGNTFTRHQSKDTLSQAEIDALIDIPWAVLDYVDASTKQNFTSWPNFLDPHADHGDFFSEGGYLEDGTSPAGIVIYGYGNRSATTPAPFAAEDIVILTDSVCHSACAAFVEMMHHEAGVHTVVVGGRPNVGPMQAVAGTRGALAYSTDQLDYDMYMATTINSSVVDELPQSHVTEDLRFWITSAGINIRDQIREGETEHVPQQFAYEAADCRIYWTYSTFNDFRNLWQHAADATWKNPDLCVKDSRNFHSTDAADTVGPSASQKNLWNSAKSGQRQSTGASSGASHGNAKGNGIASGDANPKTPTLNTACKVNKHPKTCARNEVCSEVSSCKNGKFDFASLCKQQCTSSSQCLAYGQRNFCNVFDLQCKLGPNGQPRCSRLNDKKVFQGSGSQQSTAGKLIGGQYQVALAGFCERRIKTDAKCLNWLSNPPPAPKASMAALAQASITNLIEEVPTSPDDQDLANYPTIEDGSVGAAVNGQFGAGGL